MEDLMSIYQKIIQIENQNLDDIKEMEEKYHEFEHEPIKERLESMANVHTAREFGLEVPNGAFKQMAAAIDDASKWEEIEEEDWFDDAQEMADNNDFFHWKLAYPEVFYEEDGEKKEDAGFDVVIGNPPYVRSITLKNANTEFWNYLKANFKTASYKEFDIYACFTEKGVNLSSCRLGYILPNKFVTAQFARPMRKLLTVNRILDEIIDFNAYQIFDDVTTYTCLMFLDPEAETIHMQRYNGKLGKSINDLDFTKDNWDVGEIKFEELGPDPWNLTIGRKKEVLEKIGVYEDVERVKNGRNTRAGRGKSRGRKYKRRVGPLLVVGEDKGIFRAARNLPGVDVVLVDEINSEFLSPGGKPARLTVWTKSAIEKINRRFSN